MDNEQNFIFSQETLKLQQKLELICHAFTMTPRINYNTTISMNMGRII